jgi:hypothetical protein
MIQKDKWYAIRGNNSFHGYTKDIIIAQYEAKKLSEEKDGYFIVTEEKQLYYFYKGERV